MRLNTEEKQMIIERLTEYNSLQTKLLQEKFNEKLDPVKELPDVKQFIAHVKDLIPEAQDEDFTYEEHWNTKTVYVTYCSSRSTNNNLHKSNMTSRITYLDARYNTDIPYPKYENVNRYIDTSQENLSKYYVIFSTWDVNKKNKLEKLEELINLIIIEETKEK